MKKNMKFVSAGESMCLDYQMPIIDIVSEIRRFSALGATHIDFEIEDGQIWDSPLKLRIETDDEYNSRIEREARVAEKQRAYDLAQLERLKKLYENG